MLRSQLRIPRTNNLNQIRLSSSTVKTTSIDRNALDIKEHEKVFSMVQPTGRFHLGNYLGAIRLWRDIVDVSPKSTQIVYGVCDLHAMTIPKSPSEFRKLRYEAVASILSTGIDHDKAIVYMQSSVPEHSELQWILSCVTGVGYLNRMTQWKSKSEGKETASLGLFAYPVLQAADILLFKSTLVPVGEDQSQHLELSRHIAEQFNKTFKKTFKLPSTIFAPTKKVLSLKNPLKKMSKSEPDQNSVIYMNDQPDVISKKIKKAVTDSISYEFKFDPENRPGVSNMINILSGIQRKSIQDIENDIAYIKDHKTFKDYVAEVIIEEFREPRSKFDELMADESYLREIVKKGDDRAREIAQQTIRDVKKNAGLD